MIHIVLKISPHRCVVFLKKNCTFVMERSGSYYLNPVIGLGITSGETT